MLDEDEIIRDMMVLYIDVVEELQLNVLELQFIKYKIRAGVKRKIKWGTSGKEGVANKVGC